LSQRPTEETDINTNKVPTKSQENLANDYFHPDENGNKKSGENKTPKYEENVIQKDPDSFKFQKENYDESISDYEPVSFAMGSQNDNYVGKSALNLDSGSDPNLTYSPIQTKSPRKNRKDIKKSPSDKKVSGIFKCLYEIIFIIV